MELSLRRFVAFFIFGSGLMLLFVHDSGADEIGEVDKIAAPYFFIPGEQGSLDKFPLKQARAEVSISGVIANVTISQVYENQGKNPLEAVYIFPGSTRSAVNGLEMKIGDRTIKAEIDERAAAKKNL